MKLRKRDSARDCMLVAVWRDSDIDCWLLSGETVTRDCWLLSGETVTKDCWLLSGETETETAGCCLERQ
jgi:hypothetical protein